MGSGLWQLLPDGLGIELAEIDAQGVTIGARSTASEAECPVCCRPVLQDPQVLRADTGRPAVVGEAGQAGGAGPAFPLPQPRLSQEGLL